MNYKEIVDLIKTTSLEHFFINEFGYGDISDINNPEDEVPPNYPYAFLNPVSVSNNGIISNFTFNLIVMTQGYETQTDEIEQQSNCIRYLGDILGRVNNTLTNPLVEFNLPFSINPFKERFSDDVIGASGSITITYPTPFNECESPYSHPVKKFELINMSETYKDYEGTYTFFQNAYPNQITPGAWQPFKIFCEGDKASYTKDVPLTGSSINQPFVWGSPAQFGFPALFSIYNIRDSQVIECGGYPYARPSNNNNPGFYLPAEVVFGIQYPKAGDVIDYPDIVIGQCIITETF